MAEDNGWRAKTWTIMRETSLNVMHLAQAMAVRWFAANWTANGHFAGCARPEDNSRWIGLTGGFGSVQEDTRRKVSGIAGLWGKTTEHARVVRNKPVVPGKHAGGDHKGKASSEPLICRAMDGSDEVTDNEWV